MIQMKGYVFLVLFCIATLHSGVANAAPYQYGSFDPVREDVEAWVCYDYSIDYARNNPEWGVVTVSNNPHFYGLSHMVNYKIADDEIYFYDSQHNIKCSFDIENDYLTESNYWFHPAYYHFWSTDETPMRNYRRLQENSKGWLNV